MATGNIYLNTYTIPPPPLWIPGAQEYWYDGPLRGDSGGALIDADTGNLCGVNSRFYPGGVVPFLYVGTEMAALDSDAAQQFLNDFIFDRAGNFLGECNSGPTNLRDIDTDNDLIPDACDPCPDVPEPTEDGVFLEPADFDHDGVPDACDNCPTVPNPYNVITHLQADEDDDGIGNLCDLCPHSDQIQNAEKLPDLTCCATDAECGVGRKCFPADARSVRYGVCASNAKGGRCEGGVDLDSDLIGETCDPCPGTFNADLSDTDGDGVGDACDDCPGSADGVHAEDLNPPCPPSNPTFCPSYHDGSVCVPPHRWSGTTSTPRCTKGFDNDLGMGIGDGVGDRCDNCKNTLNPFEGTGTQPNCNIHSEMKLGVPYPYVGDACDQNPCTDLDAFTAPACPPSIPCPAPQEWPWVKVAYSTNLLPKSKPFAYQYPTGKVPAATVGIRRCKCGVQGQII